MISKESTPKLQITICRQLVVLFNEASYFPCITYKWGMNFTSEIKIYLYLCLLCDLCENEMKEWNISDWGCERIELCDCSRKLIKSTIKTNKHMHILLIFSNDPQLFKK